MEKGFLSGVWGTAVKGIGLFGIPVMFGLLPKAAVLATAANPGANLFDIMLELWSMFGETISTYAIPGGSIILGQLTDGLGSAFNVASGAIAPAESAASLFFSPAP